MVQPYSQQSLSLTEQECRQRARSFEVPPLKQPMPRRSRSLRPPDVLPRRFACLKCKPERTNLPAQARTQQPMQWHTCADVSSANCESPSCRAATYTASPKINFGPPPMAREPPSDRKRFVPHLPLKKRTEAANQQLRPRVVQFRLF
eukprot:INCI5005.21.p2 GENE.INCI5005.21~~INCI5005.21.p2  ORF type:complete len:147 (+),score=12.76 INCI5005.21:314-754(+)